MAKRPKSFSDMDGTKLFEHSLRKRQRGASRSATKPKKVQAQRERAFQGQLARIRADGVLPQPPKESTLPAPQIFKPKKRSWWQRLKETLWPKSQPS